MRSFFNSFFYVVGEHFFPCAHGCCWQRQRLTILIIQHLLELCARKNNGKNQTNLNSIKSEILIKCECFYIHDVRYVCVFANCDES